MATDIAFKSYKDISKGNWGTTDLAFQSNLEAVKMGLLIRQTEAMEKMAGNYLQLQKDIEWWKARAERFEQQNQKLENENRTLRGVATRHRNEKNRLKDELQLKSN